MNVITCVTSLSHTWVSVRHKHVFN